MKKIILLMAVTLFLSACGFHAPRQASDINAVIVASENNTFAEAFKRYLDPAAIPSVVLQIGFVTRKQQSTTYKADNQVRSYTLDLSVPIKIFDQNKKLLLLQIFSASSHLNKITDTQTDTLQIKEAYQQLQDIIARKVLRRLAIIE
jgi:outer membrane lipopolysaccharide assembly protein LptE/RlpB